jgi:predicted PurR-regulated permease PerM
VAKKSTKATPMPVSRELTIAVAVALLAGFLLVREFVPVIIVSIILGFMFTPIYNRFNRRVKSQSIAAALTLLTAALTIIIPLILVIFVTVAQVSTFTKDISELTVGIDYRSSVDGAIAWINETATNLTGGRSGELSTESITERLSTTLQAVGSGMVELLLGWFSGIASLFASAILFLYLFLAIVTHHRKIIDLLYSLNPLDKKTLDVYLAKAGGMTTGIVRGQFIIAIVQGALGAVSLAIVQIPYVAFFFVLLSFLSIIPLGSGIITIPVGLFYLFTGNIWQALVILLIHFVVTSNIDNVLRPMLVPKEAYLHPALTMLAVFAGLSIFGFMGIIIGPVVMILVVTTLQTYAEAKQHNSSAKPAS